MNASGPVEESHGSSAHPPTSRAIPDKVSAPADNPNVPSIIRWIVARSALIIVVLVVLTIVLVVWLFRKNSMFFQNQRGSPVPPPPSSSLEQQT